MARSQQPRTATVEGGAAHAANLLLLQPAHDGPAGCGGRLGGHASPAAVVLVSLTRSPTARLAAWREAATTAPPERVAVVAPGVAVDGRDGDHERVPVPDGPAPARVARVGQPPDLVGLWMALGRLLGSWSPAGRVAVCVDSLAVLLQCGEPRRVFRFCRALADRVRAGGDAAHYHLDPGAVDDRAVEAFSTLFDGVAEHRDGAYVTR